MQDPLRQSFLGIYIDPLFDAQLRLREERAKLCIRKPRQSEGSAGRCFCTLQREEASGGHHALSPHFMFYESLLQRLQLVHGCNLLPGEVLWQLARIAPEAAAVKLLQLQVWAEAHCPAPNIPDKVGAFLLGLAFLLLVVLAEAAWACRDGRPSSAPSWPEKHFFVKSPMANLASGLSWAAGFVVSILALQTVALNLVEKHSSEAQVARSDQARSQKLRIRNCESETQREEACGLQKHEQ